MIRPPARPPETSESRPYSTIKSRETPLSFYFTDIFIFAGTMVICERSHTCISRRDALPCERLKSGVESKADMAKCARRKIVLTDGKDAVLIRCLIGRTHRPEKKTRHFRKRHGNRCGSLRETLMSVVQEP